jgi:uncharacterized radical SAM superfamily Fe-S cluster-containing enzyme
MATVYVHGRQVFMEKTCPQHGILVSIVEKDPELYMRLCHQRVDHFSFNDVNMNLIIPVEYRCNLNCVFCFLPHREKANLTLEEIEKLVSGFKGGCVELSGGEPTLRRDICEIIKIVKSYGKKCRMATNGLKLTDRDFVSRLKEAGLDAIFLSLYGTNKEIERKICGDDVLGQKLLALKIIKETGLRVSISMTIVPKINEDQIRDTVALVAQERINFLTLWSVARVGRYFVTEKLYLSDLLNLIQKALDIRREDLLSAIEPRFTPYFVYTYIQAVENGKVFHPTDGKINSKVKLAIKLATRLGIGKTLFLVSRKLFNGKNISHRIRVRIASWPDKYDADFDEIKFGRYQHVYEGQKAINFFDAMILNDGL